MKKRVINYIRSFIKRCKPCKDKTQIFFIPSIGITINNYRRYKYSLAFAWLTFRFSISFYDTYKNWRKEEAKTYKERINNNEI